MERLLTSKEEKDTDMDPHLGRKKNATDLLHESKINIIRITGLKRGQLASVNATHETFNCFKGLRHNSSEKSCQTFMDLQQLHKTSDK